MTSERSTTLIVMDSGGTNQHTVYSTRVEEIRNATLTNITPPKSSANWSSGPNDTKVVDLLRKERRFSVDGYVDSADRAKIRALFESGGVFTMTYDGESISFIMDKLTITDSGEERQDEFSVKFTGICGVNL